MTQIELTAPRVRLGWLLAGPLVIVVGIVTAISPPVGAAAVALAFGVTILGLGIVRRLFVGALFVLLTGYMFLGRGFAYFGIPPLYVGEIVLALAVFAFLVSGARRRPGLTEWVIVAFMAWGAARTVPYIGAYGIDALRDGVLWIYATFALVLALMLNASDVRSLVRRYSQAVPVFVLLLPFIGAAWFLGRDTFLPLVPGSDVQVIFFKPGDMGVHLAGAAAFLLAGFTVRPGIFRALQPVLWIAWLVGAVIVASYSRAAMLASSMAVVVLPFRRHLERWLTPILIGVFVVGLIGASGIELDIGRRAISLEQLISNFASVAGDSSNPELTGTKEWREEWWSEIVGYTIDGQFAWSGKGYGINLALVDGFLGDDPGLRAPHSAHFDILARSGIPGLVLWLALLASFAVTMIRAAFLAARNRQPIWVATIAWILAYWVAAVLDMSFDVYLEGPQGGILFWSITGAGLAVAAIVRELLARNVASPSYETAAAPVTAEAFASPVAEVNVGPQLADYLRRHANDEVD